MGRRREYHERVLIRAWMPDVVAMVVVLQLSFLPTVVLSNDHRAWVIPWLLATMGIGLLMLRVDELLVPRETKLRWNDWGLAIVDRSGRVTRSVPWASLSSFRVDRCVGVQVLVLVTGANELSMGTAVRIGDVAVDHWTQRTLIEGLRSIGTRQDEGRERAHTPRPFDWNAWSLLVGLVVLSLGILLIECLSPSTSCAVAIAPTLWIAHRVEPFRRAVRASMAGRGWHRAYVARVVGRALVVDHEGREIVMEEPLVDPRDGTLAASACLGPTLWLPGEVALIPRETIDGGYRTSQVQAPRSPLSRRDRTRARGGVMLSLCAALVIPPSAMFAAPVSALVVRWMNGLEASR